METSAQQTDRLVAKWDGAETEHGKPFKLEEHFWLARPYNSDEYAQEVFERYGAHTERWRGGESPVAHAIMESYRTYHGLSNEDDSPTVDLTTAGEYDEFMRLFINDFRGLVRHQIALLTADRPVWDPQARTSDAEAARQVTLARNLLDWGMQSKGFEKVLSDAAEMMKVCGASFIVQGWNPNGGHKGEGDSWSTVLAPWECVHEEVRDYNDCQHWIFPRWESRWDWVAHFKDADPRLAERLASHSQDDDFGCGIKSSDPSENDKADRIPVLYVYANPSRACPLGRLSILAGPEGELVLYDGPSPYGQCPIRRMCASEFLGTSVPYATSWPMLPIQKALDVAWGVMVSRLDAFGVPNVASQEGVEFEEGDLAGANSLKYPPGSEPPTLVDLLQLPSSLGNLIEALGLQNEKQSGINSVTRGAPTENITSGSMAALVAAQASQFNSSDERAYNTTIEAAGTDFMRVYQKCATTPQIISIVGQDERYSSREFKREDLGLIQRIAIKVGNAYSRTIGGRIEMANAMLQQGMFQDPREFLEVVKTGNMTPLFSGPTTELELIKSENEAMARGKDPLVSLWDNDELHIRNHKCQLDTGARYDQAVSERINKHLMAHMESWQMKCLQAPDVLAAIGQNPLPASQAAAQSAQAMQGGAPMPPAPPAPPQKSPNAAEPPKSQPGPKPQPPGAEPSMAAPSMPEPAQPPNGSPQ